MEIGVICISKYII